RVPGLAGLGGVHGPRQPGNGAHRAAIALLSRAGATLAALRAWPEDGVAPQASPDLAAGVAAAGAAAGLAASVEGASAFGALAPSSPARLRLRAPSFLKSVSYQPPPARRNEGAVTARFTEAALQDGQVSGSGSESFCSRSKLWPHCSQRNA